MENKCKYCGTELQINSTSIDRCWRCAEMSKALAEFLFRDTQYGDSRDKKEWKDEIIKAVSGEIELLLASERQSLLNKILEEIADESLTRKGGKLHPYEIKNIIDKYRK